MPTTYKANELKTKFMALLCTKIEKNKVMIENFIEAVKVDDSGLLKDNLGIILSSEFNPFGYGACSTTPLLYAKGNKEITALLTENGATEELAKTELDEDVWQKALETLNWCKDFNKSEEIPVQDALAARSAEEKAPGDRTWDDYDVIAKGYDKQDRKNHDSKRSEIFNAKLVPNSQGGDGMTLEDMEEIHEAVVQSRRSREDAAPSGAAAEVSAAPAAQKVWTKGQGTHHW